MHIVNVFPAKRIFMKITEFKTESGSTYQVDYINKLIRRISGTNNPTNRQGQDGNWKAYQDIVLKEGEVCFIFWDSKTTPPLINTSGSIPATATSKVVSIINFE